ncbi:MAG: hypothetical protein QXG96_04980 [Candidatus Bathyarchaeia archaeon]
MIRKGRLVPPEPTMEEALTDFGPDLVFIKREPTLLIRRATPDIYGPPGFGSDHPLDRIYRIYKGRAAPAPQEVPMHQSPPDDL